MATRCRFSGCCRQRWWWWWWWWCRHRKRKQHQKRQLLLFLLLLLLLLRHSIVDGLRGCRKKQATATAAAKGQTKSKPNANAQGKRHLHSGWMDAEVNGDRGERTALSQTHTAWQTHTDTDAQTVDNLTLCWQRLSMRVQSWLAAKWQQQPPEQIDSLSLFAVHCTSLLTAILWKGPSWQSRVRVRAEGDYLPEQKEERGCVLANTNAKLGEHADQSAKYWWNCQHWKKCCSITSNKSSWFTLLFSGHQCQARYMQSWAWWRFCGWNSVDSGCITKPNGVHWCHKHFEVIAVPLLNNHILTVTD